MGIIPIRKKIRQEESFFISSCQAFSLVGKGSLKQQLNNSSSIILFEYLHKNKKFFIKVAHFNYHLFKMPLTGFEPVRMFPSTGFSYYSMSPQPHYCVVVWSTSSPYEQFIQVAGVCSLHIYDIAINLARRSLSHSPFQPASTLRVSSQALSFNVCLVKSPGCLPIPPQGRINLDALINIVAKYFLINLLYTSNMAGEEGFEPSPKELESSLLTITPRGRVFIFYPILHQNKN